jgi:hypothetical protein
MTVAFIVGIVVSPMAREECAETMVDEKLRTYLGVGAE